MRTAHVQKIEERRKDIMDYVKAFVVGGIICAIVQILMEKTKLMPGRIMVMLVCTGALLGAVGVSAALIFSYIAALITKPKLKS